MASVGDSEVKKVEEVDAGRRGRDADRPSDIPPRGLLDVAVRVKDEVARDNVSLIAAGLALYALLAIFPAMAASVSLYGLFASPDQVAGQIESLTGVLPADATSILRGQLEELTSQRDGALGFGAALGLLIALWSARKGMTALMAATNIAYDEREERGFLRQIGVSLAFVLGAVTAFVVVMLLAVAIPVTLQFLGVPEWVQNAVGFLRWAVLWLLIVLALAVVYRFAPDRADARLEWVTWGAAVAATLWLLGSLAFSVYVGNFGTYGETYGALGGVVVLLLWLFLSGFVVVLGAEINAELEHQTARDSTRGRPQPMGERGAYVADTLGEQRG